MDTISENDSTILILLPTNTYRATDLLNAAAAVAAKQALRVLVGCDRRQALEGETPESTVTLAFDEPEIAARQVEAIHRRRTIAAIVGLDDETTELAALASGMIGLRHNSVEAVRIANNKLAFRHAMQIAGLSAPRFWPVDMERLEPLDEFARLRIPHSIEDNPDVFDVLAREVSFPCIVKPTFLSASRGVIRADDTASLRAALARVGRLLSEDSVASAWRRQHVATEEWNPNLPAAPVMLEEYIDGEELALDGLLNGGDLRVLAIFDKPDPLEGPFFEETIYVTPSRRSTADQERIVEAVSGAAAAIGLREGPIHAEVRVARKAPHKTAQITVLEVAPRSIGGLCSRMLRFASGMSQEELIVSCALDNPVGAHTAARAASPGAASGVMMIPIPNAGHLRGVTGLESARQFPGVEEITISIRTGQRVRPLPEGNRYLGFIFVRANTPEAAEASLRRAHRALRFDIEPDTATSTSSEGPAVPSPDRR